ncbi:DoxX family membrane protein [Erythrobacter gaetbuli]|uniref:DoxX family membrane protein n=1 Tax=Qipengyuania gaetbuli TaxID=266952 RepID=A0A844Y5A5_9SPHN|nr:DoxX family protein [Qipengyuania gaetbuli]MXO52222.1 DoxX family membrane protein [Qipengyuania gaetbuli]
MQRVLTPYDRLAVWLASRGPESLALLLTRVALAGIFWRSGRTKVEDGSALTVSDNAVFLFEYEYTGLPLPADIAAPLATYAEHLFPALLVVGLFTRFAALSLLGMTLVIQFFVYPEAWWSTHVAWVAMAAILVSRGGGTLSLDALLASRRAA